MFFYFFESLSLHTANEQRQNYGNSSNSPRTFEREELSVSVTLVGSSFRVNAPGLGEVAAVAKEADSSQGEEAFSWLVPAQW